MSDYLPPMSPTDDATPALPPLPPGDGTWAALGHLCFFVVGVVGPAIILLTKGKTSELVRDQAVEALNFQITALIGFVVATVLFFVAIGPYLVFTVYVGGGLLTIPAALAAYRGERYRYPIALKIIT